MSVGVHYGTFVEKSMKNFHFCISGNNEILFRSEEDYIRGFNTLAIAVASTGSFLNAEAFMSTHVHACIRTDNIQNFINSFWKSYTRYFNSKYHRRGSLGGSPFIVEIEGFHHWLTAICYVLRNPVHHGVAPTPFAYRHCSANAIFRKETGKHIEPEFLPRKSYYRFLPKGVRCPSGYEMDTSGMIMRETVLDLSDIEHKFGTPRSFLFYMNRLSGEEWKREQEKDNNGTTPVSLELIEKSSTIQSLSEMLRHEHGRSDYKRMTDIELCELIDRKIMEYHNGRTVYELSPLEKQLLLRQTCSSIAISAERVSRCLVSTL